MDVYIIFTWNDQREAGTIVLLAYECEKTDFTGNFHNFFHKFHKLFGSIVHTIYYQYSYIRINNLKIQKGKVYERDSWKRTHARY
jgi:hypothetical protein